MPSSTKLRHAVQTTEIIVKMRLLLSLWCKHQIQYLFQGRIKWFVTEKSKTGYTTKLDEIEL
jgi:hypothetical protein